MAEVSANRDVVTVERVVPAPPERIFELLADPSRHHDIDGSGTVRGAKDAPARLSLGANFGMSMRRGFGYSMVNEVVEFEEGRRIAWRPRPAGRLGSAFTGRIWRYELEPVEGGTLVRESWDITGEKLKLLVRPARKSTTTAMEATLARIEELTRA
ncbi:MAG TPA: SRPBCC family protein [Acidimicrobiia bacterium]|nr:SRPBCC family protein [Acidimicrobiia bacterium]